MGFLKFLNYILVIGLLVCGHVQAQSRCNYTLTLKHDQKDVLKNPFYVNNINSCWFRYTAPEGYGIKVDFIKFDLEEAKCTATVSDNTTNTCCDYLKIGSGSIVHENVIDTFCGSKLPPSIVVDSSDAWFDFHTNEADIFDGFKLELTAYKLIYTESFGVIASPALVQKSRYINNMNLTYQILVKDNEIINIRIQKISIENYNHTCMDYLEIGSLVPGSSIKPLRFCGENYQKLFTIRSSKVYLRLVSDDSVTSSGFELVYKAIQTTFTEPVGQVRLFDYPMSIEYTIKAPADHKIELNIVDFKFNECMVEDMDKIVSSVNTVCSTDNDHVVFLNYLGTQNSIIVDAINNLPPSGAYNSEYARRWVFCGCHRPARTYLSLGNQLKIRYIHVRTNLTHTHRERNSFKIDYKFIPVQFSQSNKLRLVQNQAETSFIDGYLLNLRVPGNHHARLHGRSAKCTFPEYSLVFKWLPTAHNQSLKVTSSKPLIKRVDLQVDEFKKNCSYSIDLSEPILNRELFNPTRGAWNLSWYLKFDSSFDTYDFELNWEYIRNSFLDEKRPGVLRLPKQLNLELAHKSSDDELDFYYKSTSNRPSYSFNFDVSPQISNVESGVNIVNLSPKQKRLNELIRFKTGAELTKSEPIPEMYLVNAEKTYLLNSDQFALNVKPSHVYSIEIRPKIDVQVGYCDFDESLCNYTTSLDLRGVGILGKNLGVASLGHEIKHLAKFGSIDMNDVDVVEKSKDFYLVIGKDDDVLAEEVIYSPEVTVQPHLSNSKRSSASFSNKKVYSISFSYMVPNDSLARLQLAIVRNRVDLNIPVDAKYTKEIIGRFDRQSWMNNKQLVKSIPFEGECAAVSFGSMVKGIKNHARDVLVNQAHSSVQNWYRVNRLRLFSCHNFRIGFGVALNLDLQNEEHKLQDKQIMPLTVGLDDIEINPENDLTECAQNVCGSNGVCYEYNGEPTCCCKPGFEGEKCEKKISACEMNRQLEENWDGVCKNGGLCVDNAKSFDYTCKCLNGFKGKNCEIEIDECESNPCQNDGKCIDRIGGFDCVCKSGFSGDHCQKRNSDCREQCSDYGTAECYNDRKGVICVCKPNFGGDDCSIRLKINKCLSNPCVGNFSCTSVGNDFKCTCPEDRTGKYCEIKINYCDQHKDLCKNNSSCLFANKNGNVYECSCPAGFTGKSCDEPINECLFNSCVHGKCIDLHMGYRCECEKGYIGRYCDIKPSDPCYRNKCVNGACVPKVGTWGYNCICHSDADGEYCEKPKCEREKYMNEVCMKNGTLDVIEYNKKCHCICKSGYTGVFCESRLNFCEIRRTMIDFEDECKNGGKCVYNNQTDAISCECPKGYSGDRCEILENNCKNNPCKYGMCKNDGDSYKCVCTKGWTGRNCTDKIEVCTLTDDCVANNTVEVFFSKQTCLCACKLGFGGERCEKNIDDCANVKCENGGTCVDLVASYKCECPTGYDGPKCEYKIDNCDSNPCKNGECKMLGTQLTCFCDRGYTGKYCDVLIDKCMPNPCQNSGICHNLIDDYYCECSHEFGTSKNCTERLVDPCLRTPCYNNATCFPITQKSGVDKKTLVYTGFTCRCLDQFRGEFCELPSDPCSSNPCNNRGRCELAKNNHDYKCVCYSAFTGKNCESHLDQCQSPSKCRNGGTCLPTPNGYRCKCPPQYDGENCEKAVSPCELMKCLHGGECFLTNNIPFCKCPNNRYIGTRCEIDISIVMAKNNGMPILANAVKSEVSCDLLGNGVSTIDYIFFALIVFFIIIFIIAVVYSYVYLRIKRTKNHFTNSNSEHEAFGDVSQMADKRYA